MDIQLESEWKTYIEDHVRSGKYHTESEVIHDALRLLQQQEQSIAALQQDLTQGRNDLDNGLYRELDAADIADYFEDVDRRGLERLQKKGASAQ